MSDADLIQGLLRIQSTKVGAIVCGSLASAVLLGLLGFVVGDLSLGLIPVVLAAGAAWGMSEETRTQQALLEMRIRPARQVAHILSAPSPTWYVPLTDEELFVLHEKVLRARCPSITGQWTSWLSACTTIRHRDQHNVIQALGLVAVQPNPQPASPTPPAMSEMWPEGSTP